MVSPTIPIGTLGYLLKVHRPIMANLFYFGPETSRTTELLLTLPPNVGLVVGACLMIAFGDVIKQWKKTLVITWIGLTLYGEYLGPKMTNKT